MASNNATHQVLVQSIYTHIYTNLEQASDFRTYLKALTGCPILKLEYNKWNKSKTLKSMRIFMDSLFIPLGRCTVSWELMSRNRMSNRRNRKNRRNRMKNRKRRK